MLGLHRLAGGVEFLAEGAEGGACGFGRVGEGEFIEAVDMLICRSVFQKTAGFESPH